MPAHYCRRLPSVLRRSLVLLLLGSAMPVAALAQSTEAEPVELDLIVLHADSSADGRDSYVAQQSSTALKAGAPISETPQSVSVTTERELRDRQPAQVEETIAYASGVVPSGWGIDNRFDQFVLRGFSTGTYGIFRDGLSQKVLNFSSFNTDPFMLERVDVLKGPASVLYGSNDVGGLVNLITKRPRFERFSETRLSYGSFGTTEAAFDTGGVLDMNETLAWRLTGLARNGGTQISDANNDRLMLASGLTWEPDAQTRVIFQALWQKDSLMPNAMIPHAGIDYPGPNRLPQSFAHQQSPFNRFDTEQVSFGWLAERNFGSSVTLRQNLRFSSQKTDYRHLYFSGMADADNMNYVAFTVSERARAFMVDNQLEYRSMIGSADNTLLVGLDYSRRQYDGSQGYAGGYRISLDQPSFDFPVATPPIYANALNRVTETGLYAQNHLRFGNGITLTAALRQSWVETYKRDRIRGTDSTQRDQALTGMIGGTWNIGNGVTPYASYSESFNPNIGTARDGSFYEPTRGRQVELGVRYEPEHLPMRLSAAVFDARKDNMLTPDPAHPGSSIQIGQARNRGFEFEARGQLTEELSVMASYTYLDAEITRSNRGDQGNVPARVPRNTLSLWLDYNPGSLEGFSLGAGIRHVGMTWGDNANNVSVPSYTLADMSLRYEWDQYQAALTVNNLFDRQYLATCAPGSGCAPGEERKITASLGLRF